MRRQLALEWGVVPGVAAAAGSETLELHRNALMSRARRSPGCRRATSWCSPTARPRPDPRRRATSRCARSPERGPAAIKSPTARSGTSARRASSIAPPDGHAVTGQVGHDPLPRLGQQAAPRAVGGPEVARRAAPVAPARRREARRGHDGPSSRTVGWRRPGMRGDHGLSRLGGVPRPWRSSVVATLLSAAVVVSAALRRRWRRRHRLHGRRPARPALGDASPPPAPRTSGWTSTAAWPTARPAPGSWPRSPRPRTTRTASPRRRTTARRSWCRAPSAATACARCSGGAPTARSGPTTRVVAALGL